ADGHRARLELGAQTGSALAPLREPWMAAAADRIIRTTDRASLHFGSLDGRLLVTTSTSASDARAPALLRAVLDALAPPPPDVEPSAIPDRPLQSWTRPAGPAPPPTRDNVDRDDRRWLWALTLLLLAAEWRLRRSKVRLKADTTATDITTTAEDARVA